MESIAEQERPSITEIADRTNCSRSTVHYHLKTLQQNRYVVRDEDGLRLGLRMAHLGNRALRKHRLTGRVEKTVDNLAAETDAVAHVAVKEGNRLVWLYRSSTDGADGDFPTEVGKESHIHCTAYGQAILASLPSDAVERVANDSGLPAVTDKTLTDPEALKDRLTTIRQLGFAYSSGEYRKGISSIAAPIYDETDSVVGSIGISNTCSRIDNPYKHPKARRFSDELPGSVTKAAHIACDRVSDP